MTSITLVATASVLAEVLKKESTVHAATEIDGLLKPCRSAEEYLSVAEWLRAQAAGARLFCNPEAAELYESAERKALSSIRSRAH